MPIPYDQTMPTNPAGALKPWAQHLPLDQQQILIATANHESAHLVAALAVGGWCGSVEIRPRPDFSGALGGVRCMGDYQEQDAFICAAGVAWEERHGIVARSGDDATRGAGCVSHRPGAWAHILDLARRFVHQHDQVIRALATNLLSVLPGGFEVNRRKLLNALDQVRPYVTAQPLHALQQVPDRHLQETHAAALIIWPSVPEVQATTEAAHVVAPRRCASRTSTNPKTLPTRVAKGALFGQSSRLAAPLDDELSCLSRHGVPAV